MYSEKSKILVISPIHFGACVWHSEYNTEFSANSIEVSDRLSAVYKKRYVKYQNIYFVNASAYAEPSKEN